MDLLHVVTYATATGLAQVTGAVRVQETATALMAGLEETAHAALRIIIMLLHAMPNVPRQWTVLGMADVQGRASAVVQESGMERIAQPALGVIIRGTAKNFATSKQIVQARGDAPN